MNIAGTNLEAKQKGNNFPQIKSKTPNEKNKHNGGSVIFDSHF